MSNTHIWLGKCTGSKGLVLRTGKPFDAAEHDYLDVEDAVEKGKASALDDGEKIEERVETPIPGFSGTDLEGVRPKKGNRK